MTASAINKTLLRSIGVLIMLQLLFSFYMITNQVLFRSSIPLFFNSNYFMFQKLQHILGFDYSLSTQASTIPLDSDILVASNDTLWFLNYYFLPRRLYTYTGSSSVSDVNKIPKDFLIAKHIEYILLYKPPQASMLKVEGGKIIK